RCRCRRTGRVPQVAGLAARGGQDNVSGVNCQVSGAQVTGRGQAGWQRDAIGQSMDWVVQCLFDCVVFVVRMVVQRLRGLGCGQWPAVAATVTATPRNSSALSGGEVEIVYAYRIHGELYTGIHEEPFLLPNWAQEYVARFPSGGSLVLRVDP